MSPQLLKSVVCFSLRLYCGTHITCQQAYHSFIKSRRRGEGWAIRLIHRCWKMLHLGMHRNAALHESDAHHVNRGADHLPSVITSEYSRGWGSLHLVAPFSIYPSSSRCSASASAASSSLDSTAPPMTRAYAQILWLLRIEDNEDDYDDYCEQCWLKTTRSWDIISYHQPRCKQCDNWYTNQ